MGDEPTGADSPNLLTLKHSKGHADTIVHGISRIGFMTGGKSALWKDEEMAHELTRRALNFVDKNKDNPFFLYFATHDVHVPRVPHPRFRGKSGCGVRGDVIEEFDACVGEVMKELDRMGLTENTLVIVSSDNGGVMDDGFLGLHFVDPDGDSNAAGEWTDLLLRVVLRFRRSSILGNDTPPRDTTSCRW